MSFASSVNSSLVPINPKYPTTDFFSAGYVETPVLDYSQVATQTNIGAFSPILLPQGVWLLTGVLQFEASSAGNNITQVTVTCLLNQVINQGQLVATGTTTSLVVPISFVVSSGTEGQELPIALEISAITSAGGNWNLATGLSSILRLVRIA